jgi:hypothetical protein
MTMSPKAIFLQPIVQPVLTTNQQVQQYLHNIYNQLVQSGYYQTLFLQGITGAAGTGAGKHYTKNDIIAACVVAMNAFGAAESIKSKFNLLLAALFSLYSILAAAATDNKLPPATRQQRLQAANLVANLTKEVESHANALVSLGPQFSIALNQIIVRTQ